MDPSLRSRRLAPVSQIVVDLIVQQHRTNRLVPTKCARSHPYVLFPGLISLFVETLDSKSRKMFSQHLDVRKILRRTLHSNDDRHANPLRSRFPSLRNGSLLPRKYSCSRCKLRHSAFKSPPCPIVYLAEGGMRTEGWGLQA